MEFINVSRTATEKSSLKSSGQSFVSDSDHKSRPFFVEDEDRIVYVKVSKKGKLVRIKEVPSTFWGKPYRWDEDE
jgi:hypothetical protein